MGKAYHFVIKDGEILQVVKRIVKSRAKLEENKVIRYDLRDYTTEELLDEIKRREEG